MDDQVIVLTNRLIGKVGYIARVTKIGKRISIVVQGKHTNRAANNIKDVTHHQEAPTETPIMMKVATLTVEVEKMGDTDAAILNNSGDLIMTTYTISKVL